MRPIFRTGPARMRRRSTVHCPRGSTGRQVCDEWAAREPERVAILEHGGDAVSFGALALSRRQAALEVRE